MAYASRIEGDIHERGNLLVGCNGQYQLNEQNKYVLQDSHDNGIYNLRGEKVTSMLKGNVYVVNGKKIMVR